MFDKGRGGRKSLSVRPSGNLLRNARPSSTPDAPDLIADLCRDEEL